jgi:hypothetical protein
LNPDHIRDHLRKLADDGVIPDYGVPDKVLVVEALARTSVDKLDKKMLRKIHGGMAWMHTAPRAWDHSLSADRLRVFRAVHSGARCQRYLRDHGAAS